MTITELRNNLSGPSEEYRAKQLHAVPSGTVVNRESFILERVKGKVVLDIGASGRMHEAIVRAAKRCYGIDKPNRSDVLLGPDTFGVDLNSEPGGIPKLDDVEVIVCGEVIEHLSNPGNFIDALWSFYECPVIITVPNAFSDVGRRSMETGIENVNLEHVAYYSYWTLRELVTRHGYKITESHWYNGRPMFSEGLIFVVE